MEENGVLPTAIVSTAPQIIPFSFSQKGGLPSKLQFYSTLYYIILYYIILQAFYFDKWEEIFVQATVSTAPNIITFYCSQKGRVCLQATFSTVP